MEDGRLTVTVWESDMHEFPQPYFQVEINGVVYQGRAEDPPSVLDDGRLQYRLRVEKK